MLFFGKLIAVKQWFCYWGNMNKIILNLIVVLVLSSCFGQMPIMNNAVPFNVNEFVTTLSQNFFIVDKNKPVFYGAIQKKYNETISFELNTFGAKIIEDLYYKNRLYINSFQSVYLALRGIGSNAGFVFSFVNKKTTLYLSTRIDNIVIIPVQKAEGNEFINYLNFTPTTGMSFNFENTKLFAELVFSLPLLNNGDKKENINNELYSTGYYSLMFGISF